MSYPKAKINELQEQINVLERAFREYPDNMDLVKTAESIKRLQCELVQWQGLEKASFDLRLIENTQLN